MDALVRAFASDDDVVVVAVDEGGTIDDGVDGASDNYSGASDARDDDPEDAASDMSD